MTEASPRIVLVTRPVVMLDRPVFAGAVMGPAEGNQPGLVWLDLNVMGQRLPQMYREAELEDATPELLAKHDLCHACRGYGLMEPRSSVAGPEGPVCEACEGSGSTRWHVRITRQPDGSTFGRIEQRPGTAT